MRSTTRETLHTAALRLPNPGRLRPEQIRGDACIWGGDPIDDDSAVDLGRRSTTFMGIVGPWSPKACVECVRDAALKACPVHLRRCQQCQRNRPCDTLRALHRLALEGR